VYKAIGDRSGGLNPTALLFFDRVLFPIGRRLDRLTGKLFGKNCLAVAVRP
jgi:hypothetical protein